MGFKVTILMAAIVTIASTYPQAVSIGKGGVSASFGGYHASAGLGGVAGDGGAQGGLFARAGLPDGTGAAAGLGGSAGGGAEGGAFAGAGVAGGPKASAGLGGVAGAGGGLHAEAAAPGVETGVVKTAVVSKTKTISGGATGSVGGTIHVAQKPSTFFDDIFNIPTSVLTAVNTYLNNRAAAGGGLRKSAQANFKFSANGGASGGATGGGVAGGESEGVAGASLGGCANTPEGCVISKTKSKTGAKVDANFHLNARTGCDGPDGCVVVKEKPVLVHSDAASSASSSVSVSGSSSGHVVANKNYDGVFNIPISALKSVNQFLNNLGK